LKRDVRLIAVAKRKPGMRAERIEKRTNGYHGQSRFGALARRFGFVRFAGGFEFSGFSEGWFWKIGEGRFGVFASPMSECENFY